MHDALMHYFNGEKYAGLLIAVVGLGVIAAAVVLLRARADLRPFAITLIVFAAIEIALGFGLYLRTGPQVARLEAQLASDAGAMRAAERTRMDRVQRTFVLVEYAEVTVILVAALVALVRKHDPLVSGIALGFLISAAMLLAFDIIAERRGDAYVAALRASE